MVSVVAVILNDGTVIAQETTQEEAPALAMEAGLSFHNDPDFNNITIRQMDEGWCGGNCGLHPTDCTDWIKGFCGYEDTLLERTYIPAPEKYIDIPLPAGLIN